MELQTKQIETVFQAQIGPLNDMRRRKLIEVVGPPFVMGNVNIPNAAAFLDATVGETLIVADNHIRYAIEGADIQTDYTRPFMVLKRVFDTLLLDERMPGNIQIIAHMPSESPTTEMSVENFSSMASTTIRKRIPGLRGIGMRYNFEVLPYRCDLHIEPFFANPEVWFLRVLANTQNPLTLDTFKEDVMRFWEFLRVDAVEFLHSMLREA